MLIVVPVSRTDDVLIEDFIKVFNNFGPYKDHKLLVVARPNDEEWATRVYNGIKDNEFKSHEKYLFDFNGPSGWPMGPNHYWHYTVRYIEKTKEYNEPWLWMELDMTPVKDNWANALEEEYINSNKPFMGMFSWTTTITSEQKVIKLCNHLVGVAIYPPKVSDYSKVWKHVSKIPTAWDILTQWEVIPLAHKSDQMQNLFRTQEYTRIKDKNGNVIIKGVDANNFPDNYRFDDPVDLEKTVMVHGCIDGSLSRLILNNKFVNK